MKNYLLLACFMLSVYGTIFGQNLELRISSGLAVATSDLDNKLDWKVFSNHANTVPINLDVNYRFFENSKLSPFVGTGVKYVKSNYFQNVESLHLGYNVSSIEFSQKHVAVPLRLGAEWNVFAKNAIGFQYELQYNAAVDKENVYSIDEPAASINGSLEYTYSLTTRTQSFRSGLMSMYVKTELANNLFMIASVGYENRRESGDFDYLTEQEQTLTDSETGDQTVKVASYSAYENEIENNLLHFNVGISKYF